MLSEGLWSALGLKGEDWQYKAKKRNLAFQFLAVNLWSDIFRSKKLSTLLVILLNMMSFTCNDRAMLLIFCVSK